MEARRFPEPEVVGSIPTAGDFVRPIAAHWGVGDTWIAARAHLPGHTPCGRPRASTGLVTNDSKATVSVLYWYGNYPNLTEQVSDFLGSGPALAPGQLYLNAHLREQAGFSLLGAALRARGERRDLRALRVARL